MRTFRPVDRDEIGHRAFAELVAENLPGPPQVVIWYRASEQLKQHYFDRHIPRAEQDYLKALIDRRASGRSWRD